MKYVLCLTTVSKRRDAERIASHLIRRRLAACVNILPGAVSFYRWKQRLCREREFLLFIKTIGKKLPLLGKELQSVHPYQLPEWVVLPFNSNSRRYLSWISKSVTSSS